MGDRFYCTRHMKPMTGTRIVHSGQPVRRCEDCVREAKDKVHALMAAFDADPKATPPKIVQCGRAT